MARFGFQKSVGAGFPCHPIVAQHVEARLLSTQVSDFNVITYTTLTIIGNLHNLKRPSRRLRSEERAWHFFLHSEEVNNDKIGFMKVFVPCSLCTFKKPLLQIGSVALSALPNPSATVQWNPSHCNLATSACTCNSCRFHSFTAGWRDRPPPLPKRPWGARAPPTKAEVEEISLFDVDVEAVLKF